MSHPIRRLHDLAECCVFGIQSAGPGHCGPFYRAPLLPKLRGYFAEFLREVSLARLSLLDSPTCVGLRYGQPGEQQGAFLGGLSSDALRPKAKLRLSMT